MAIQGLVNSNTGRAASFEEEAKQAVTGGSGGSAAKWEASSESAMIALSDATPGDVCLRTDEALFRKLKPGGTYSTASD